MRLPSLQYIVVEARASLMRFPLVLAAALTAAVCGIIAVEVDDETSFVRVVLAAQLGLPLFFALSAAAESGGWPRLRRIAANIVAVGALFAYHSTLPDRVEEGMTRFLQFNVGLHLLVAFLPFTRGRHNGFWQYNRALFLRFLTALLYSAVIYLGLALALLALDRLLGVPVPDRAYMWLFIVTAFVFNTWVFLGGVPRDLMGLESVSEYPRGLRVFAQYILIPLVVVYLAILTAYLFKIIVTTVWPSGWIGWMVSSVAVVGITALLLVWPVATHAENRWVATYTRWFFVFMIPAIVMLMLAVQRRIEQYGVTENRYFLAVLSAWLAAMALYFIFSRERRIKVIPVTLCVVAFATSFGPWGAYTVSRRSQTARLERLMAANGILVDGAMVKTTAEVSFEDRREISAATSYLVQSHGTGTLGRWVDVEALTRPDSTGSRGEHAVIREFVAAMGIVYVEGGYVARDENGRFNYSLDPETRVFDLGGAGYLVKLGSTKDVRDLGDTGLVVAWEESVGVVLRERTGAVLAAAPVDSVFSRAATIPVWTRRQMSADVMRVEVENDRARLIVHFSMLGGVTRDDKRTIDYVNADCFVTLAPIRR